jgi:hypothetical protein
MAQEGEADRQTGRPTDGQTERTDGTDRRTDGQTEQTNRPTDRQADGRGDGETGGEAERQGGREAGRQGGREAEGQTERQTDGRGGRRREREEILGDSEREGMRNGLIHRRSESSIGMADTSEEQELETFPRDIGHHRNLPDACMPEDAPAELPIVIWI